MEAGNFTRARADRRRARPGAGLKHGDNRDFRSARQARPRRGALGRLPTPRMIKEKMADGGVCPLPRAPGISRESSLPANLRPDIGDGRPSTAHRRTCPPIAHTDARKRTTATDSRFQLRSVFPKRLYRSYRYLPELRADGISIGAAGISVESAGSGNDFVVHFGP